MTSPRSSQWLQTTVGAVRELMEKRLAANPDDEELQRDVQMALEELDVMWEELEGQAERLLRESKRYAEFFDYAPDAYLVTDAGGNIREANRAASEFFAASRDELVGRPLASLMAEQDRVAFLSHFVGTVLGEPVQPATWRASIQVGGKATAAIMSVRAIPLRRSGVAGLCWLIRPA